MGISLRRRRAITPARAIVALLAFPLCATPFDSANALIPDAPARRVLTRETWIVTEGETTVSSHRFGSPARNEASRRTSSLVIASGSDLILERDGDEVRIIDAELYHNQASNPRASGDPSYLSDLTLTVDPSRGSEVMWARSTKGTHGDAAELVISAVALDETEGLLTIWLASLDGIANAETPAGSKSGGRAPIESLLIRARVQRDDSPSDDGARQENFVVAGSGSCPPERNFTPGPIGPDITVFSLPTVDSYGSGFPASAPNGIAAFAVGTTSCNIGDTPASWYSGIDCSLEARRNRHPVIGSGMFRLSDGRFEQIGLSWVKHGFFALNQNACGQCVEPIPEDIEAGYFLGVHCSDPYSALLNGSQAGLGPRSQINAFSGSFAFPPSLPPAQGTKIERRLQVHHEDLDPTTYPDALYFVESEYIAADDAFSGNGHNNCAYRKINMIRPDPSMTNVLCPYHRRFPPDNVVHYCAIPAQSTVTEQPAIRAWQDFDPNVVETDLFTPEDPATSDAGLVILSAKATIATGGLWHYEYAMENVNSDRSVGSFRVTIPAGAIIENVGFHDVPYHSGNLAVENQDGTDWEVTITDNTITWHTLPFAVKQNANALRWGTTYNFRFDINAVPQTTTAVVGLFKPKPTLPDQVTAETVGPAGGIIDCNNNGVADPCDVACGPECGPNCGESSDCDFNGVPDDCEPDCNENDVADLCDVAFGTSDDCNVNDVPDECEPDCDHDGVPNVCEVVVDEDGDGVLDCDDSCPFTTTTPPGACVCPERGLCCFPIGICIPDYLRDACLDGGGTPDCGLSPCRAGCLVGDGDRDGDRDLADFAVFMSCFSGNSESPAFIQPSQTCRIRFDYNDLAVVPGDVDLADYIRWVGEFSTGGPRVGP